MPVERFSKPAISSAASRALFSGAPADLRASQVFESTIAMRTTYEDEPACSRQVRIRKSHVGTRLRHPLRNQKTSCRV